MANIKNLYLIYIIIGFVLFGYGMKWYYLGFHSLDLGHNLRITELYFDTEILDIDTAHNLHTPTEVYIKGIKQMDTSLSIIIVSCVLFSGGLIRYVSSGE